MLKYLVGSRIADAVSDSWDLDGLDGRVCAAVVVFSLASSITHFFVNVFELFN